MDSWTGIEALSHRTELNHPESSAICTMLHYTLLCYTRLYYTLLFFSMLYYTLKLPTLLYDPYGIHITVYSKNLQRSRVR